MCEGLNREGGLFKILAERGGAYKRGGLNRAFTVRKDLIGHNDIQ